MISANLQFLKIYLLKNVPQIEDIHPNLSEVSVLIFPLKRIGFAAASAAPYQTFMTNSTILNLYIFDGVP